MSANYLLPYQIAHHNGSVYVAILPRYLSYLMNIATPTMECLGLLYELLIPVIKARTEKCLTRQEVSLFNFLQCNRAKMIF